jgi:hypothetical protein
MSNLDTLLYLDDPLISDAKKNTIKLTNPLQISLEENTAIQEPVEIMVDLVAVEGEGSIPTVSLQAPMNSQDEILAMAGSGKGGGKGGGNGGGRPDNPGGGGGHTETQGNNLSFPALLADGFTVTPITEPKFEVEYTGPYTGLTQEQLDYVEANGPWYAQKVEGNVWQADVGEVGEVDVYFVDWGDAIESTDPKIGRPYRLELALYAQLTAPMTAYTMAELAFPSSPQETQGTNTKTYESEYATIATPKGKLVVQKYDLGATLTWNGSEWDGADDPENVTFAQELNVGGKYIFGASTGGWKPDELGEYRITFYFAAGGTVNFIDDDPLTNDINEATLVGDYNGGVPIIPKVGENNTAVVDPINNITYIDVTVVQSGGGGGSHEESIDLFSLGSSDSNLVAGDPMLAQFEQLDLMSGSTSEIFPVVASDVF